MSRPEEINKQQFCSVCGEKYLSRKSNSKYCADCGQDILKVRARERARKKRLALNNILTVDNKE